MLTKLFRLFKKKFLMSQEEKIKVIKISNNFKFYKIRFCNNYLYEYLHFEHFVLKKKKKKEYESKKKNMNQIKKKNTNQILMKKCL